MLDLLIITGASKGIGRNIANNCFNHCKNMIVISSSPLIYNVGYKECNVIPLQLDLSDYNNVESELYKTVNIIDKISPIKSIGIVLCGAKLGNHGGLLNTNLNDWDATYKCNVLGNLSVIRGCRKLFTTDIKSRIVFFGGGGAAFGYPEFSGYSLSKVAVVRAVENLALDFDKIKADASIIALAPGAVATDILDKVLFHGGSVRTKTDIKEPTDFVIKFINDEFNSKKLNGKFLHVRDDIQTIESQENDDLCKLRRIQ
ncbi:FabG Dehydrogenases with different specificities (related to short-chain alcohol dehydrogenases) [uncultured Caudovirales phage]|uniref:FabG Dehydrogenases with different specificities (Related to short-chain alcohol dehydrogenases) n=1 Tax=uncultured Caudovirales phage TaxID=2100421 RepID=A0A6J5RRS1_9CAUD|nr:FabG Dehydrogenases with different specificities (related to short-chain alcohol dehydrogenases) [uncultured Caudovirales phage]